MIITEYERTIARIVTKFCLVPVMQNIRHHCMDDIRTNFFMIDYALYLKLLYMKKMALLLLLNLSQTFILQSYSQISKLCINIKIFIKFFIKQIYSLINR